LHQIAGALTIAAEVKANCSLSHPFRQIFHMGNGMFQPVTHETRQFWGPFFDFLGCETVPPQLDYWFHVVATLVEIPSPARYLG
jgi:hypothetical protein